MARARKSGSGAGQGTFELVAVSAVFAVAVVVYGSWWLGATLAGLDTSGDPFTAMTDVVTGARPWPVQATVIAVVLVLVVVAAVTVVAAMRARGRTDVDSAAATMVAPGKLSGVSRGESHRLVPQFDKEDPRSWGIMLGRTVRGDKPVYLSWENVMVALAGTRMGKTVAIAVPAAMAAPGALIVTTNKPDLYPLTRGGRERFGQVWVFDLQGVTGTEQVNFWWNPLKGLDRMAGARKIASYFVSAATQKGSRADAYFDGEAQETLALYCLAAGLAGGDLLHVATWLSRDQDETAVHILTAYGKDRAAESLREKQALTDRQRDGIFGMARRYLSVLSDDEYAAAVMPPARAIIEVDARDKKQRPQVNVRYDVTRHDRPELDPWEFAASTDTLYALSMEGPDSASALTTALVGQIFDAATALGAATPARSYEQKAPDWMPARMRTTVKTNGGRLETPLVAVLDEATNTVLLKSLPDQYSHFGGRGIIPIAILQSPQQGTRMWGQEEFEGMLAGSVHYYGGNVKDRKYLSDLSDQIGRHEVLSTSRSTGRGGGSSSQSWQERSILTIDDLAALPKDRAIVSFPANRPVLIKKSWWWEADYADVVRDSIRRYSASPDMAERLLAGGEEDDDYGDPEPISDAEPYR
ncbi:type IV secretory system conjugative DNA transfer family protein [Prescottella equi]|uniref:type IV secretory system conjugative DNA transfer family protein n=1 Tax=Rhodococcus hoagii TaxID=43767 RepID=UPI000AE43E59|nr:TraM recognition domain-containing protein [Prescottella equi]